MRDFSSSCSTDIKVNGENKIQDILQWIFFKKSQIIFLLKSNLIASHNENKKYCNSYSCF